MKKKKKQIKNIFLFVLLRCDIEEWHEAAVIPRDELLNGIAGKDALFCTLTDRIDAEVIDRAGPNLKVIGTMSVG